MAFVGAGGVVSTRKVVPKRVASSLRVRVAGRKFRPPPVENPDKAVIPSEVDLLGWEPEPIEEDEFAAVARTAAEAADERKGRNIVALRVARLTHTTTFFVYITGGSGPQLRAIVNLVEERLKERHNLKPLHGKHGNPASGWLLLDYGDLMINVFSEDQRKYYDPESLWINGEKLDLSSVVSPDGLKKPEVQESWDFSTFEDDEDDGDWTLS